MNDSWESSGEGRYANHFQVGCNDREAILDFGQDFEGEAPRMHTRIIMSAAFLDPFVRLIQSSLAGRAGLSATSYTDEGGGAE